MEPSMNQSVIIHTTLRTKLLLITGGLFLAIIFAEVGLRTAYYFSSHIRVILTQETQENSKTQPQNDAYEGKGEYRGKYEQFALVRFSSFLGYSSFENHQGNGYVSNNYGFRYKENFPPKKPKEEVRIFVTGGSAAWGVGSPQEYLYTTRIEKKLQEYYPNLRIRVISAGVGGYFSTHERILILNKISEFEPDVVVMFSGWNDTYAGYDGFQVLDDKWDFLKAGPVLAKYNPRYSINKKAKKRIMFPKYYKDYIFKTHFLLDRYFYGRKSLDKVKKSIERTQIEPQIVIKDLIKNILVVYDLSKRQDFMLIFYLQPTIDNTKKSLSPFENSILDYHEKRYVGFHSYNSLVYDLYRKELPKVADKEGFLFVDGDDAISHESKTVFDDNVHFGDRGNRLISEHMTSILHERIVEIQSQRTAEQGFAPHRFSAPLQSRR
jgi:lysophospholipase L1-like esterase